MGLKTILLLTLIALVYSQVVVLDDSNYTSFVQEHPYVFVKFYAPWCGHCKSMAPDYQKLGEASEGKEYTIAKVDSTTSPKVSEKVGVEGYPTLKLIVQGVNAIDYPEERNLQSMKTWLEGMMSSTVTKVDEDKVKEMIGSTDFLLIQGASEDQLKLLRFGKSGNIDFYSLEGGDFKVTLYLKNTKTLEYNGEVNLNQLSEWIFSNTLSTVVALSSNQAIKYVFQNKAKLPSFILLKNKDWTEALTEVLTEFCEENKESYMCAFAGEEHEIHQGISRFVKSPDNQHSMLVFFDHGIANGWQVPEPLTITKQSLSQFIKDMEEGKVQKFHDEAKQKQQKEQASTQQKIEFNHVLQLTSQTYNQTLKDNRFVFVEYYSPTCGHCIQFAPEYQKFAEEMKQKQSEYVIAAVDMANEKDINDWVSVNGYPTLRFYLDGVEFDYEGDRKGEDIVEFMDKVRATTLDKAESVEKLQQPFVAVFGISDDSPLQRLAMKFTKYPVYSLPGDQFKIQILDNKFAQYTGDQNMDAVANWLDEKSEEVLVNVAQPTTSKKLNRALENQTPILLLMNRDDAEVTLKAKAFLEGFCEDKVQYICGIANKGDKEYQAFDDWIDDPRKGESRLMYLTTEKFEKYLYEGELAALQPENVAKFVDDCKNGKINPHLGKQDQEAQQNDAAQAEADASGEHAGPNSESGESVPEQPEEGGAQPAQEPLETGGEQL